jgi:hypothetical protein
MMITLPERYTGIIRCLPSCYGDASIGAHRMRLSLECLEEGVIESIGIALAAKPRIEVLHIYLVAEGEVKVRLNIADYEPGYKLKCWDNQFRTPKFWAVCTAPVSRPPSQMKMRGFQGFRYTEALWE